MSKIKGQNLRIYWGDGDDMEVFGEATSCQISLTGNMEDGSTKDSVSGFSEETVTTRSWQVTTDTLNASDLAALLQVWKAKEVTVLKWDLADETDNSTPLAANLSRSGNAYITDISIQMNDRQNVAINITFTGSGAIS